MKRNFSLVAHYSLKFSRCSLLVVKSLLLVVKFVRYSLQNSLVGKIHLLLVAEVACCKESVVTHCKICSLLIVEVARCKKSLVTRCRSCSLQNFTCYLLQNSLVTCCRNCSLQKITRTRYSLQNIIHHSLKQSQVHNVR